MTNIINANFQLSTRFAYGKVSGNIGYFGIFWVIVDYRKHLVRKERLELSRLAALEPKSSASTNSATFACLCAGDCSIGAKSLATHAERRRPKNFRSLSLPCHAPYHSAWHHKLPVTAQMGWYAQPNPTAPDAYLTIIAARFFCA